MPSIYDEPARPTAEEIEANRAHSRAVQPYFPCARCNSASGRFDALVQTRDLLATASPDLVDLFIHLPWRDANGQTVPDVKDLTHGPAIYLDWGDDERPVRTDEMSGVEAAAIVAYELQGRISWESWGQQDPDLIDVSGSIWASAAAVDAGLTFLASAGFAEHDEGDDAWYWPLQCSACLSDAWSRRGPTPALTRGAEQYRNEIARIEASSRRLRATLRAREAGERVRTPIAPRLRFEVLRRDGFRCTYCGRTATEGAVLHVDHLIPVASGGPGELDNLVTACSDCNLGKSSTGIL